MLKCLKIYYLIEGPNPKIERSYMDGNKRKSVIVNQIFWPNGLTIDYMDSKIYWADAKHHVIEKASFDGRNRKRVSITSPSSYLLGDYRFFFPYIGIYVLLKCRLPTKAYRIRSR